MRWRLVRVLIGDDSAIARALLARIVRSAGHEIAGEALSAQELIARTGELRPDLVALDSRLPPGGGLAVIESLLALPNPPRIVLIASLGERNLLEAALRAGALGGFARPFVAGAVAETLRRLARTE